MSRDAALSLIYFTSRYKRKKKIQNFCLSLINEEMLSQCWNNVGPSSTTLAQHQSNIGTMCRSQSAMVGNIIAVTQGLKGRKWQIRPFDTKVTMCVGLVVDWPSLTELH